MAQPPPPPVTPPLVISPDKSRIFRSSGRGDRIQRSLESMTARHCREDVQQLIFRYLQQSGYFRSAMSFAYECMLSGNQQHARRRSGWNPRHPLQLFANATEQHELPSLSFEQMMDQQLQRQQHREEQLPTADNDTIDFDKVFKQMYSDYHDAKRASNSMMFAFGNKHNNDRTGDMYHLPSTSGTFDTRYAVEESFPAFMSHEKHVSRHHQPRRGSSPLGTILLLVVIYALIRMGSIKF